MDMIYIRRSREVVPSLLSLRHKDRDYHLSVIHSGIPSHRHDPSKPLDRPHRHRVYHLLLFLSGENSFIYGNKVLCSERGLLLLCSPDQYHSFIPRQEGEHSYMEITFEYRGSEGNLDLPFSDMLRMMIGGDVPLPGESIYLDESSIQGILDCYHRFLTTLRDEKRGLFEKHLDLAELLRLLLKPAAGSEMRLPELVRERILGSIPGSLDLETLSRETGRSRSYIIREFKREYGSTPIAYYRQQRLTMAADLLYSTDRTMEEIARLFDFCDVFHFMKAFKAEFGLPPGEYRRENRR